MGEVMHEIGYELSSVGQAFVAFMERDREASFTRKAPEPGQLVLLEKTLIGHQLPVSREILDFERQLGGWATTHERSVWGYGVLLSLKSPDEGSPIADLFRRRKRIFSGRRDAPNENGERSPLWGSGYPRSFFLDRPLVPAGMSGEEMMYLLDSSGAVYVFITLSDELILLAGSGRTLIESFGLRHQRENHSWYEAHVCADVSALVADFLDVPVFEPACDHLFKWWANDTVQMRLVPDYAPCIMGTHIACKEEGEFMRVMERIRTSLKVDRVRLWERANNIFDDRGRHALAKAGVDVDLLRGAGPGNYECAWDEEKEEEYTRPSQYDASLCDPENWHIPGPNMGVSRTSERA